MGLLSSATSVDDRKGPRRGRGRAEGGHHNLQQQLQCQMFHSHADISVNFAKPFFLVLFIFLFHIFKETASFGFKSVAEKTIAFLTEKYWSSRWSSNLLLDQCFCE